MEGARFVKLDSLGAIRFYGRSTALLPSRSNARDYSRVVSAVGLVYALQKMAKKMAVEWNADEHEFRWNDC
jgi:hypothetical protein